MPCVERWWRLAGESIARGWSRVGALGACALLGWGVPGCSDAPIARQESALGHPALSARAAADWSAFKRQAARRLVATNASGTYTGAPPDILLAIPVLEIELTADGGVKHIEVLRYPGQARETVQMAIDAVHRAAPFGDMRGLPRPWKYTETFLFNDDHRFKPRTLDD